VYIVGQALESYLELRLLTSFCRRLPIVEYTIGGFNFPKSDGIGFIESILPTYRYGSRYTTYVGSYIDQIRYLGNSPKRGYDQLAAIYGDVMCGASLFELHNIRL
jgi:hypothetical protein